MTAAARMIFMVRITTFFTRFGPNDFLQHTSTHPSLALYTFATHFGPPRFQELIPKQEVSLNSHILKI